jgi:Phospholipase_D-nuclease N-terminal
MLLLGALFALFIAGFWVYCLVDVALTPRNECRGLPKAAWVVIVAGTFVAGAVAWLTVRSPARPALPRPAPGRPADPGRPGTARAHHGKGQGPAGPDSDGPGPPPPEGRDRPLPRNGRPDPHDWDGPVHGGWDSPDPMGSLEAEAALLRHPAGRARPRSASSRPQPKGPDDDPEFLNSLDRVINPGGRPPEPPATPR